ncbi:hypothetical protein SAMN05216279_1385 [Pseudomonas oryzihabitans]|uniref:Tandem-95 repeat protein n=2 Tax=Pseudomonas oryzihabitans TaxID=47885 RepID=A0A1G5PH95_9PSED|nr:hypothetical protein SAMN05216279_1385 [Pseudomonas psychrotolerans]
MEQRNIQPGDDNLIQNYDQNGRVTRAAKINGQSVDGNIFLNGGTWESGNRRYYQGGVFYSTTGGRSCRECDLAKIDYYQVCYQDLVSFTGYGYEDSTNYCPAAQPSGSIYVQRRYEQWSDGSRRNYTDWYETSRTCQAIYNSTQTEYRNQNCPASQPQGTITQQQTYEVWSDGSRRNDSGWSTTGNTCTAVYSSSGSETRQLSCPAATPSGTWMQRRTYDIYSDGSRRNESAWSDTSTCYNRTPSVSDLAIASDEDTQAQGTIAVADDHTSFTYQIVSAPPAAAGTASFSGNKIVFSPVANWNGATSLTYRAQDPGGAWSNIATVSITIRPVNDAPVAQDKALTLAEDSVASVVLTATDIDSPAPSVFQLVQLPPAAAGQVALSGNVATFKPPADWNGSTSFTYRAQDSAGAWSATATVQITVTPVNDAPVVQDATLTTAEDTPGSLELSATDIDSPAPSRFEIVTVPPAAAGTAAIQGKTLSFTPAPDWNGSTALSYRAQDDAGAWSAPATIRISVTPVNDAPVAQQKTLALDEDTQASVQLTATDVDSPTPTVFDLIALPPASVGQVTLAGATATFKPAKDWNGTTQFTYRAQDTAGAWSSPAAVAVTVRPINDAPAPTDVSLEIRTKESLPVTTRAVIIR